jgi:DNA-binding transcriptional regulator YdaS (Cro superfamily)
MGSASCDLAPEGVRVGSPSHTSMDVHVGSSPPHSGCMAIAQALGQGVTLEASAPDDTELVPTDSLRVVSVGDPSSSHQLTSHSSPTSRYFGFFWSDFTPCR